MTLPVEQALHVPAQLDLRGEVCPYTFVKTKLALENLQVGQLLRVVVDNDESGENVPRSLQQEGHRVLEVRRLAGAEWAILVERVEVGP